MKIHEERRHLPYPPDEVFSLVADVERYPEFLPWCEKLAVTSRTQEGSRVELVAAMTVSFKIYRERFLTRVRLDRDARTIFIDYLDGPFKRLENSWRFFPAGDGTDIAFRIAFEFKSRALQLLVGVVFEEAFRRLVGAFEARARALYGRRTANIVV